MQQSNYSNEALWYANNNFLIGWLWLQKTTSVHATHYLVCLPKVNNKDHLRDQYVQIWNSQLSSSTGKLRFYKLFKTTISTFHQTFGSKSKN